MSGVQTSSCESPEMEATNLSRSRGSVSGVCVFVRELLMCTHPVFGVQGAGSLYKLLLAKTRRVMGVFAKISPGETQICEKSSPIGLRPIVYTMCRPK